MPHGKLLIGIWKSERVAHVYYPFNWAFPQHDFLSIRSTVQPQHQVAAKLIEGIHNLGFTRKE